MHRAGLSPQNGALRSRHVASRDARGELVPALPPSIPEIHSAGKRIAAEVLIRPRIERSHNAGSDEPDARLTVSQILLRAKHGVSRTRLRRTIIRAGYAAGNCLDRTNIEATSEAARQLAGAKNASVGVRRFIGIKACELRGSPYATRIEQTFAAAIHGAAVDVDLVEARPFDEERPALLKESLEC